MMTINPFYDYKQRDHIHNDGYPSWLCHYKMIYSTLITNECIMNKQNHRK